MSRGPTIDQPNKPDMRRSTARWIAMVAALASAVVAASCVAPRSQPEPLPRPAPRSERVVPLDPSELVEQVVEAHNARRDKAGLPALVVNPELEAAASEHARDMADRRKMSHKGGDGSSPFDRMTRQGYHFRAAAENVAYGFDDIESVMLGWMRSPGHKRNILGKYSEIGVGRAIARDGASYWCVTFGTPSDR
jgi:uncharacterized protein YkwD